MKTALTTALVTGANGFIGRRLCEFLLACGLEVRALLRTASTGPWRDHFCVDLSRDTPPPEAFEGVDVVFHLAGKAHAISESKQSEEAYAAVNTEGTRRLVEACLARGVPRLVFASTVKAMGDCPTRCLDETFAELAASPYGRSKRAAEAIVLDAAGNMHVCVLRLPLVYGVGVKGNLEAMLKAVAAGRFPPIRVVNNKRSMIDVHDVARALCCVAQHPHAAGEVFIVTDENPYSTWDLYRMMCDATGRVPPMWSIPVPVLRVLGYVGDGFRAVRGRRWVVDSQAIDRLTDSAWYSSDKIRRQLGFQTTRTLSDWMREESTREPR